MAWLAALVALPFAEIALFVIVGSRIGVGWTLALVVLAVLAGTLLIRREGVATAAALRRAALRGEEPVGLLADGGLRLLAGALLIAPGFLTDALALLLLLPPTRRAMVAWAGPRLSARVVAVGGGTARRGRAEESSARGAADRAGDVPIEAEYVDLTDRPPPRP